MLPTTDQAGINWQAEIDRATRTTFAERRAELDQRIDARLRDVGRAAFHPTAKSDNHMVCQPEPAPSEKPSPSVAPAGRARGKSSRKTSKAKAR